MIELWPPQQEIIDRAIESIRTGHRRPLAQSATGSGKTIIAGQITKQAREKFKRVNFIAPRRELVFQARQSFYKHFGLHSSTLMAGETHIKSGLTVSSIDTIAARYKSELPEADLIIVDEAHLFTSPRRIEILKNWSETAIVLGLTATPAKGNGRGLGDFYDDLILSWPIEKLIEHGYLVPPRYFAPSKPDLTGVKISGGDYQIGQLGAAMDKPKLIGDIVDNWFKLAAWKKTAVFCSSKKHSRHVCEEFLRRGVAAEHLDSDTPQEERRAILERVVSGETTVLCNVFIASYGLDIPSLECVVIARPTKSIVLYMQIIGRALRTHPHKLEALVIDHSGCIEEHGFVESIKGWSLDSKGKINEAAQKEKEDSLTPKEIVCMNCLSVFSGVRKCPSCGHEVIPASEKIPVHEADLVEINHEDQNIKTKQWNIKTSWADKEQFYGELLGYAKSRGYKDGWAKHQYRQRSGVWPNDRRLRYCEPREPTELVKKWNQHQWIKFHKYKKSTNQKLMENQKP